MSFRYPNLIVLNGSQLTDESRTGLQEDRDERSVIIELGSGRKRKFIKGIFRKWSMTWENVGMTASKTVDGCGGRNEIRALAQSGLTMPLIIQDGTNAAETYTVFISSYTENPLIRRGVDSRYTCTLELEEEG